MGPSRAPSAASVFRVTLTAMPMGSITSSPTNQHSVPMEQSVEQGSASGPLPAALVASNTTEAAAAAAEAVRFARRECCFFVAAVAVEAVVDGAAVDAAEAMVGCGA